MVDSIFKPKKNVELYVLRKDELVSYIKRLEKYIQSCHRKLKTPKVIVKYRFRTRTRFVKFFKKHILPNDPLIPKKIMDLRDEQGKSFSEIRQIFNISGVDARRFYQREKYYQSKKIRGKIE